MSFRRFLGPLFSWGKKGAANNAPFNWEKFRERNLTTKKLIGIVTISYFGAVLYYFKGHYWSEYQLSATRIMSRMAGRASRITVPTFMRSTLFGLYAKVYDVKLDETVKNIDEYTSFAEFFTREIKPRPFSKDPTHLVSPADSKILVFSEVDRDQTMLIKGQHYKMGELLTGITGYELQPDIIQKELKKNKFEPETKTKLYQCILYLAPGDYHRFHSPSDFLAKKRNHIHGFLLPVKVSVIEKTPTVYATNERVGIFGEWPYGFMSMVFVGALNVGSVTLNFDQELKTNLAFFKRPEGPSVFDYANSKTISLYDQIGSTEKLTKVEQASIPGGINIKKGDEIGRFNLGSTIVLVFEAPENFVWNIKEGQAVRYGETIGFIPPKEATPSS